MALTIRYVRSDADGTGDGTTDANSGATGAFTFAQMISDVNTPRVGYKYLIKAGTYSRTTTNDTITGDGTATSPNVFEGFNSSEGDLLANGRDANGDLVTTNFPVISYTTGRVAATGGHFSVFSCLTITSAATGATLDIGNSALVRQCSVTNSGTGSGSAAIRLFGNPSTILDCMIFQTGGSGGAAATDMVGTNTFAIGCKAKSVSGSAYRLSGGGNNASVICCTAYESVIGIELVTTGGTGTQFSVINNTVANCSGNGIDIASASISGCSRVCGNHVTGNGGFGIDFNASVSVKHMGKNRFRDNTSGATSGSDDYETATSVLNVTSDDTDALDFTDQANDNYTLLTTAAAITAGVGYKNPIGAHGAGSFPSGSGGIQMVRGMAGGMRG